MTTASQSLSVPHNPKKHSSSRHSRRSLAYKDSKQFKYSSNSNTKKKSSKITTNQERAEVLSSQSYHDTGESIKSEFDSDGALGDTSVQRAVSSTLNYPTTTPVTETAASPLQNTDKPSRDKPLVHDCESELACDEETEVDRLKKEIEYLRRKLSIIIIIVVAFTWYIYCSHLYIVGSVESDKNLAESAPMMFKVHLNLTKLLFQ